jgi:hypothetical protein
VSADEDPRPVSSLVRVDVDAGEGKAGQFLVGMDILPSELRVFDLGSYNPRRPRRSSSLRHDPIVAFKLMHFPTQTQNYQLPRVLCSRRQSQKRGRQ